MNTTALFELRRVVESAPPDLFHMRAVTEQSSCGTAHCAFGWATLDPWFQANTKIAACIRFKTHMDFAEAASLFDLPRIDADNLFGGGLNFSNAPHAVTATEVLWNIDEILAGRPALPYRATKENVPVYAGGTANDEYDPEDYADTEES